MATRFILNEQEVSVDRPVGRVMLDVLRQDRGLKGVKEGCREGDCGACMVLLGTLREGAVEYYAVNSCLLPLGTVAGKHVVTIEGLNGRELTPVQQAIVDEGATQCGFCTPGFVIALTAFLLGDAPHNVESGCTAVSGNLCRCTGYLSIRRVLARVCSGLTAPGDAAAAGLEALITRGFVPSYFGDIPARLAGLAGADGPGDPSDADAVVIAGGTDLIVQRPEDVAESHLVLLERREDLRGVCLEGAECRLGAATPIEEITRARMLQQLFPSVEPHIELISSVAIRHRATVGGNLVNASPIGDMAILLLALNADVILCRGEARRRVALREFFTGYKQLNRVPGELVEAVCFARPPAGSLFNFEKVSRRKHLDIASVNSAMMIDVEAGVVRDVHLSAGGVAPVPLYLAAAVDGLRGRELNAGSIRAAAAAACAAVSPISDVRGSAAYKRLLLGRLVCAHFIELFPDRFGEELLA